MRIVAKNKKAYFEYEILEKYEAGICLLGNEVKSILSVGMSIKEAYIKISENELILFNSHVSKYKYSGKENFDEYRDRKLLLHKNEISKIISKIQSKGYTLIPVNVYLNSSNLLKVEIAIAKGKKLFDKRIALKEKDLKRELNQIKKYGQ